MIQVNLIRNNFLVGYEFYFETQKVLNKENGERKSKRKSDIQSEIKNKLIK